MHPIERLRYVARSGGGDPAEMVRETASALRGLGLDPGGLVQACRRIVQRHPSIGPLWWLCARMLTAAEPHLEARRAVEEIESDCTARVIAEALPDDAVVTIVGWPGTVTDALRRRGDVTVYAVESGEGVSAVRWLRHFEVQAQPIAAHRLGSAVAVSDVVMIEAGVLGPSEAMVPLGGRAAAAAAVCSEVPSWLVVPVGCALPDGLWAAVLERTVAIADPLEADDDLVPAGWFSWWAGTGGVVRADGPIPSSCPMAVELVRASPM